MRIVDWNGPAEDLTGITAKGAIGRFCWEVIAGKGDRGQVICHPGCSLARRLRQGRPGTCAGVTMRTPHGQRRIAISTIVARNGTEPLVIGVLREARPSRAVKRPLDPPPKLTPRQLEILGLLARGIQAREIARRLTISEATVRNHIRAVLLELRAHSQLEAVAKARRLGLVQEGARA